MKSSKGFSLLETMVVIGLLAILTAIAVPSIISQRNTANLRDAVSMIRGDFKLAQSRAILENAFVPVIITANGYTIFIDNGTGGGGVGNWERDGTERLLCDRKLPAGIKIDLSASATLFTDPLHPTSTRFDGRGYSITPGFLTVYLERPHLITYVTYVKVDMNNRFGRITTTYTYRNVNQGEEK